MKNILTAILLTITFVLTGCGSVSTDEMDNCFVKTKIFSTPDVTFYAVKDNSEHGSYSDLKADEDDLFFCFYNKKDPNDNLCADLKLYGFMTKTLPQGISITLDGKMVKTKRWGFEGIGSDLPIMTHFRGYFKDHSGVRTIWISAYQVMRMFESKSDFSVMNQDAFNALLLKKRLPNEIERNPDGSVTQESGLRHYEAQQQFIANWNCELKFEDQKTTVSNTETKEIKYSGFNENLHIDHWIGEACKINEPCINRSSIVIRNDNQTDIEIINAEISNPSSWRIVTPNSFPIRVSAGKTYIISKEMYEPSMQKAEGGTFKLTLNDNSIFQAH